MEKPFAAYVGDEAFVFVCYAHEDSDVVYPEMAWLHDEGVNLWYDEGISAGKNWRTVIGDSLLRATHVLFYISTDSLKSDHCNREINLALDEGKSVIPVYIEDIELTTDLKVGLNRVQALRRDEDTSYQAHLLSALGQSGVAIETQPKAEQSRNQFPRLVGWGLALVILAGTGLWYFPRVDERQVPASVPTESLAPDIAASHIMSIAVLPFVNLSDDPEQEFFSDGIAEDILNELAKNAELTVRPRSSSFALKSAGLDLKTLSQRLNVTHVLEGSIRRSGERIRITVQLSDVASDRSIWSERYDRKLTDVFAVQDSVVEEVLSALSSKFEGYGSSRYAPRIEAYEAYLRGRSHVSRVQFELGEQWLKQAVELDPSFADAWAYRGQNLAQASAVGFSPNSGEFAARRREYTLTALELDPTNVNARATHALFDVFYTDRDYESAVNDLIRLVRLNPNNELAHFHLASMLAAIGRLDLYSKVGLRIAALAPESMTAQLGKIGSLIWVGAYEQAHLALQDFEAKFDYPLMSITLAIATGNVTELETHVQKAGLRWSGVAPIYAALVPYLKGDVRLAREMVSPLHNVASYQPPALLGAIALIEGDLDTAFEQRYNGIYDADPVTIISIQGRADFRQAFPEFFADPRYEQMLRDAKLDRESVAQMRLKELPF